MRVGLLEDLAQRMRISGYPEDFRRSVLEAAVGGYEGQVAAAERGEKPLYRPRGWQEANRRKSKMLKKASWYRPADFVLFVPATPGGKLASACREVLEEEGGRLQMKGKVVERGGVPLSRQLVQTDLAAGNPCSAPKCLPCTNGKKPGRGGLKHHRAGHYTGEYAKSAGRTMFLVNTGEKVGILPMVEGWTTKKMWKRKG